MAAYANLREMKKAETKEAIFRAAIELFATRGFSRTTIGMIARKAHIAPRTLFTYYPSKKEILFSIASSYCSALIDLLRSSQRTAPTFQVYKTYLYATLETTLPNYYTELDTCLLPIVFQSPELSNYIAAMKDRLADALAYAYAKDMGCALDDFPARFAGDTVAHSLWVAGSLLFPSANFTKEHLDMYFEQLEQTVSKIASPS